MVRAGSFRQSRIIQKAARLGYKEIIVWARSQGCRWSAFTCATAAAPDSSSCSSGSIQKVVPGTNTPVVMLFSEDTSRSVTGPSWTLDDDHTALITALLEPTARLCPMTHRNLPWKIFLDDLDRDDIRLDWIGLPRSRIVGDELLKTALSSPQDPGAYSTASLDPGRTSV